MNILKSFMKTPLHTKIFAGLILGIPAGLILGPRAEAIKPVGDIFIRLIWMIVVPLVFASIFVGTASLGDLRKLGRIGAKTIAYYLFTTAIAITIGLTIANVAKPGTGLNPEVKAQLLESYQGEAMKDLSLAEQAPRVIDVLIGIVPKNPIGSLAAGDMLQIIFFAIMLGVAVTMIPGARERY